MLRSPGSRSLSQRRLNSPGQTRLSPKYLGGKVPGSRYACLCGDDDGDGPPTADNSPRLVVRHRCQVRAKPRILTKFSSVCSAVRPRWRFTCSRGDYVRTLLGTGLSSEARRVAPPPRRRSAASARRRWSCLPGPDGRPAVGHGPTEPADQVGGLLVPVGLGQGGEAERSANRNVCTAGSDRYAIAHRNVRQTALRVGVEVALYLVERRGFELLTPCMPLTSHPLTSQHTPMCSQASALLSTPMADGRRGAACGVVRPSCRQIAGRFGSNAVSILGIGLCEGRILGA